ncbi:hypothetical protein CPB85DRAFT_1429030 [Mucidula mucida]|nr:hypothetical protein CPB85DRAFT_1429030 [Mucidula mucida]
MHACPICGYENMQKSNVDTHIRTHTKLKSRSCPDNDCSFSTSDPGSLTRHRKRAHGYVPKPRRPRDRTVPYAPRSLSSSASPQGPPSTLPVGHDDESAGSDSDGDGMGQHTTHDDLQRTIMVAHVPRKIRGAL